MEIYQLAMKIGEKVWLIVESWEWFAKKSIGFQFVESTDSIAANISEGYGRYHFKQRILFMYYSRGSLMESKTWATKAHNRKLIHDDDFENLINDLKTLSVKLNNYISNLVKQ